MTKKFYQIRDHLSAPYFRLYYGDNEHRVRVDVNTKTFKSVGDAKAECWHRFHEVAIRVFGDEQLYDADNPVHYALSRLEARHSGMTEIVAVAAHWYLVRRSKFGAELKIHYEELPGVTVYARDDEEPIPKAKETA